MQYIINLADVCIDQNVNSVNAKDLHEFMGVKSKYSDWIKNRIKKYGFIENEDYIRVETKKEGNNAIIKEYYITLDMAKELSMVENNPKGREARRYFIEIEKQYRNKSQPYLIDGKDPRFVIGGYKTQNAKLRKKLELLEEMNEKLLEEVSQLALPAPSVDVEPYKAEIKRLNTRIKGLLEKLNQEHDLKEHFSHMAGIQVFKTVKMFGVIPELQELQADFIDNPKMYAKIGEKIRACQILRDETLKHAQSFRKEMV